LRRTDRGSECGQPRPSSHKRNIRRCRRRADRLDADSDYRNSPCVSFGGGGVGSSVRHSARRLGGDAGPPRAASMRSSGSRLEPSGPPCMRPRRRALRLPTDAAVVVTTALLTVALSVKRTCTELIRRSDVGMGHGIKTLIPDDDELPLTLSGSWIGQRQGSFGRGHGCSLLWGRIWPQGWSDSCDGFGPSLRRAPGRFSSSSSRRHLGLRRSSASRLAPPGPAPTRGARAVLLTPGPMSPCGLP
jgi:hypothetical protein